MPVPNLLLDFASEMRRVVRPVEDALASEEAFVRLLADYGWLVDPTTIDVAEISDSFAILEDLGALGSSLGTVLTASPDETGLDQIADLVSGFKGILSSIRALSTTPAPVSLSAELWTTFSRELLDGLVAEYVSTYRPLLFALVVGAGVIEEGQVDVEGTPGRQNYVRRALRWDRLAMLLTDPFRSVKEVTAWGAAGESFRYELLFERIARFVSLIGFTGELREPSQALVDAYYSANNSHRSEVKELHVVLVRTGSEGGDRFAGSLFVLPIPAEDPSEAPGGLVIGPSIELTGDAPAFALSPYSVTFSGAFARDRSARIEIRPSGARVVPESPGDTSIDASVELSTIPQPVLLLGSWFSHFLSGRGWSFRFRVLGSVQEPEIELELAFPELELVLDSADFDAFLNDLVSTPAPITRFNSSIVWSSRTGLHFRGGGTLDVVVPVHRTIGAIEMSHVAVSLRAADGETGVSTAVSGSAKLGPVLVGIANVGLEFVLTPVPDDRPAGVLGDLDLDFAFKPPAGMALSVDAGPITGGGFLSYDDATGRYAGALELEVHGIGVKAIGLLDTRIPGGRPAYSFLLIVSAEFTPIPLGLGFTLNGVGGLAGIHRRMEVEALRTRLRAGSLDHLLFAEDPIKEAGRIVSDLQEVFPPAQDRYVFGPMAVIGWGTPPLLECELALLLELPDPARLVLLGQLHLALPRKDRALIEINLDVLGEIDLNRGRVALDGRLRDSRVVSFPIEGEMAMRLAGRGDEPNFALAIGGFHPDYTPPPGFPQLRRITIPIGLDDNPRLTLQGYLALTSNTLQVGAAAELYAEKGWFNITGEVTFDALFTFVPFAFVVDVRAKVALRKGSTDLAAIRLSGTLSGPTPWHAAGKACLEIRWFPDICVGFSATFGREEQVELPRVDPWPLLQSAVQNPESWSGTQPPRAHRGATLAGADGVLHDPALGVMLRQTVVPLRRWITKFGEAEPPGGATRFDVAEVTLGGSATSDFSVVEDFFAPAQFEQLSDDEKLSRPSFEPMDAGLTLAGDAVDHGSAVGAPVEYETRILDSAFETRRVGDYRPPRFLQLAAAGRGAAARAPLLNSGPAKFAPSQERAPLVRLARERYVVASTLDLAERADVTPPAEKGAAFQALAAYLTTHPEERGRLAVMSLDELPVEA